MGEYWAELAALGSVLAAVGGVIFGFRKHLATGLAWFRTWLLSPAHERMNALEESNLRAHEVTNRNIEDLKRSKDSDHTALRNEMKILTQAHERMEQRNEEQHRYVAGRLDKLTERIDHHIDKENT